MNELQILNVDGIECYEKDGTAYLKLETVARGLGFTFIAKSGNEVVRWNTVYGYLKDLGVATSCNGASYQDDCPDFIPENIFYRLAMKAKNETAEKFQAKVADEIIPSIRKTGGYGKPMTTQEQIRLLAQGNVELEKKIDTVNERVSNLEQDMPLYGCEIDEVKGHVNRKGINVLGGKKSNAYRDASIRGSVYSDIYRQIKREFGLVSSYKSIKRKYIADVHEFIDSYSPPLVLDEQITNANKEA